MLGDRKAQQLLYQSYYKAMMTLCVRYTKNDADAIEVLNTAFYKIFKNIGSYKESEGAFYSWIRAIVINSCLDFIKARQAKNKYYELDETVEVHIPAEAISRLKATELLKLIRKLPASTQGVFNLYVMEGYNHREIAQMLGISEGTSKWHLSEARKMLKKMICLQEANTE